MPTNVASEWLPCWMQKSRRRVPHCVRLARQMEALLIAFGEEEHQRLVSAKPQVRKPLPRPGRSPQERRHDSRCRPGVITRSHPWVESTSKAPTFCATSVAKGCVTALRYASCCDYRRGRGACGLGTLRTRVSLSPPFFAAFSLSGLSPFLVRGYLSLQSRKSSRRITCGFKYFYS